MIIRRFLPVLVLVALLAALPALAQQKAPARLSLDECLKMALANNLDLVLVRKDPAIAEQNVESQDAVFDPLLSGGANYRESVNEVFNPSDLSQSTSLAANTAISQQFGFGGDYVANFSMAQFDSSGPLFSFESGYSAGLDMTFNLPLLRGFGRTETTEQLILARNNLQISREDLRRQAHQTLETVESAYWDLVAAGQALTVARESLARAKDLLALNRKKVEVGTLAPIEITQAEAGVASQEEGVIVAETLLLNAEDELRRLLAVPASDPLWDNPIVPIDQPTFAPVEIDLAAVLAQASTSRPEFINARQTLSNSELRERAAKHRLLPQLNLSANLNPSGNNFTQSPGPDGMLNTFDDVSVREGRLGTAIGEIPDFESYDYSLSVNYSLPIGNRAAKAGYKIATLNREKSEIGLRNTEQSIRVEVRTAVRNVTSGSKRVDAARANVVLQRKKLEAEQKKFENGMSTSFEVLEFQNDLSDAELAEIRAIVDYNKSLIALERAKGTLLEARGLSLGE